MTLEPGITETNWSVLTIQPAAHAAVCIRATNEHDVVLVEMASEGDPATVRWFVHRSHLRQLIGALDFWRDAYASGPGGRGSGLTEPRAQ